VQACLDADPERAVARIVEISEKGRAPKNDPALFALALACAHPEAKKHALRALSRVARIGTHLFHFANFVEGFRGWGRGLRDAVRHWYLDMPLDRLEEQFIKYKQRDGWSHRDLLRLSHPKTSDPARNALFSYAVKGYPEEEGDHLLSERLTNLEILSGAEDLGERHLDQLVRDGAVRLITENRFPREVIPSQLLTYPEIWGALLPHMGLTAMVRNLGKLTSVGLLKPLSQEVADVAKRLTDVDAILGSRIHPVQVLAAMLTYGQGQGFRGSLTWQPVREVLDALDKAFYLSFGNVQPTGKRTMLALDVSGSMTGGLIAGVPGLTPRVGSAALALITAAVEDRYVITAFSAGGKDAVQTQGGRWGHHGNAISELDISPRQRLDDVVRRTSGLPFAGTDCALPMLYALKRGLEVDAFVIYTDSETWAGDVHPVQALNEYRRKTGIAAKLVVVGMVANEFSIADPNDAGMMDVVGFDTATPQVIADFVRG
jgi:60 kDa SS-A/Ro ribonucleoprotein